MNANASELYGCEAHFTRLLFHQSNAAFYTKQQVYNKGELPQYLLEGEFPKAVDKCLWEFAQLERKRRRENYVDMPSPDYPFRGRIFCAACGLPMVQQTSKTYGEYRVMYCRCAHFIMRCRKDDDKTCTDVRIPFDRPVQVFRQARNLIVSKKTLYQASLKRTAAQSEDPLVRYRAEDLGLLLDEVGRLDEFDYYTYIRTVDRMEVSTDGKVAVIFLAGVRISLYLQGILYLLEFAKDCPLHLAQHSGYGRLCTIQKLYFERRPIYQKLPQSPYIQPFFNSPYLKVTVFAVPSINDLLLVHFQYPLIQLQAASCGS